MVDRWRVDIDLATSADGNKAYARTHNYLLGRFLEFFSYISFASAEKGSYTTVYAAASPELLKDPGRFGAYINPSRKVVQKALNKDVDNEVLAKELWQTTQDLLTEMGAWTDSI